MNRVRLMQALALYKGGQIKYCIDAITAVAKEHGCSVPVNVMDPTFNSFAIDEEPNRLNVHTDNNSVVVSFSIG